MTGTDTPRVGFIGLGIMGSLMAENLARAGFPLTVSDPDARQGRGLGGEARR